MGITIDGPTKAIDLGCSGFARLRLKVAELTGEDIHKHYAYLIQNMHKMQKEDFDRYDAETEKISENHNGEIDLILDFLYAPDVGATVSADTCSAIYEVVKDYDDNILYGYTGRKDCAKFADFKAILLDCIQHKSDMTWF